MHLITCSVAVFHWVAYSFSRILHKKHVQRNSVCFTRLTSKAQVSWCLALCSSNWQHPLENLWPQFYKESNDVKTCGHMATSLRSEHWEELKAPLKIGNQDVIINHDSLVLNPHQLWLFFFFLSLGLSRPETAHFKPISSRPASCASAEKP